MKQLKAFFETHGQRLLLCGTVVCTVLFLFCGGVFLRQYLDGRKSARVFENAASLVQAAPAEDAGETAETPTSESAPQLTAYEKYAKAYESNPDFVGWLTIPGTQIDYPVVQTPEQPDYYLRRGFDGQYSFHGVPYVQENCCMDLSDNIVVYGHHMNDGTIFADLCRYADEDFYRGHKRITFDTLGGYGEYEVVAAFKTVTYTEDGFKYYRFVDADSAAAFDSFIAECKRLAAYDTGVSAVYGDKLLTLSTCEYSQPDGRMVVVAKKVRGPAADGDDDTAESAPLRK